MDLKATSKKTGKTYTIKAKKSHFVPARKFKKLAEAFKKMTKKA